VGSTVISEEMMPLNGLGVGLDLISRSESIRRLTVPFERRKASVRVEMTEREIRVFQGKAGETESDELVRLIVVGGVGLRGDFDYKGMGSFMVVVLLYLLICVDQ
jgi:hypothetical protein